MQTIRQAPAVHCVKAPQYPAQSSLGYSMPSSQISSIQHKTRRRTQSAKMLRVGGARQQLLLSHFGGCNFGAAAEGQHASDGRLCDALRHRTACRTKLPYGCPHKSWIVTTARAAGLSIMCSRQAAVRLSFSLKGHSRECRAQVFYERCGPRRRRRDAAERCFVVAAGPARAAARDGGRPPRRRWPGPPQPTRGLQTQRRCVAAAATRCSDGWHAYFCRDGHHLHDSGPSIKGSSAVTTWCAIAAAWRQGTADLLR